MYVVFRENYECNVYVDAEIELSTLIQNIATLYKSDFKSNCISLHEGDILISKNASFDLINRKSPEDGFLFYRYVLIVTPNILLGKDNAIDFVSKLLENCWLKGFPTVATCQYESELPRNGGYKSKNVPTPK